MGFPLAPVLANLFMGHHEKRWLENYNSGIEFYRRYVDDTFALFNTEQDALSFFSYINSQHPNIKFTMEKEENHKLPFLDPIPAGLRSRVIYKFSCAGCNACYIGETNRHFATRIREHLASDKHSHIFKHLRGSENCRSRCSEDCFKILDSASTRFQLKIKEAMHILWEQPSLNSQVKHLNLSLSY